MTLRGSPPSTATSSSLTAFTTCWPGVRLFDSASMPQRSRTPSRNALTTDSSTSASSRAARISAQRLVEVALRDPSPAAQRRGDLVEPLGERVEHVRSRLPGRPSALSRRASASTNADGIEGDEVLEPARRRRRAAPGCRARAGRRARRRPRAVPSSFVSTIPVTPTASENSRAWAIAFCPVVASRTRSTSATWPGLAVRDPADLPQLLEEVGLVVEPTGRVGEHERRCPRDAARCSASWTTAPGSAPSSARTSVAAHPRRPRLELVRRRGAERVAGREQRRAALGLGRGHACRSSSSCPRRSRPTNSHTATRPGSTSADRRRGRRPEERQRARGAAPPATPSSPSVPAFAASADRSRGSTPSWPCPRRRAAAPLRPRRGRRRRRRCAREGARTRSKSERAEPRRPASAGGAATSGSRRRGVGARGRRGRGRPRTPQARWARPPPAGAAGRATVGPRGRVSTAPAAPQPDEHRSCAVTRTTTTPRRRSPTRARGSRGARRRSAARSTFWLTTWEEPPGAMVTP